MLQAVHPEQEVRRCLRALQHAEQALQAEGGAPVAEASREEGGEAEG